jgi:hypothetical protein
MSAASSGVNGGGGGTVRRMRGWARCMVFFKSGTLTRV